jgi:hypothetical protein
MCIHVCVYMYKYASLLDCLDYTFQWFSLLEGVPYIYIYGLYTIIKGYEEMYLDIYDIDVENPWFQKMIYT